MGLYHTLYGINPAAPVLLPAIGASKATFARFRDIFTSRDGSKIYVLTQTGGGNREHFASNWEALRSMQQYDSDRDDAFNPTYAWITFKPLDEAMPIVRSFAPSQDPVLDMKVLTDRAVASLHGGEVEEGARERREQLLRALSEGRHRIRNEKAARSSSVSRLSPDRDRWRSGGPAEVTHTCGYC